MEPVPVLSTISKLIVFTKLKEVFSIDISDKDPEIASSVRINALTVALGLGLCFARAQVYDEQDGMSFNWQAEPGDPFDQWNAQIFIKENGKCDLKLRQASYEGGVVQYNDLPVEAVAIVTTGTLYMLLGIERR
jgi:hypothetical protein